MKNKLIIIVCICVFRLSTYAQTTKAHWSPPFIPIKFSIDNNWNIDVSANASTVTFLGTFGIGATIPIKSNTSRDIVQYVTVNNIKYVTKKNIIIIRNKAINKQKVYELKNSQKLEVKTKGETLISIDGNLIIIDIVYGRNCTITLINGSSESVTNWKNKYDEIFPYKGGLARVRKKGNRFDIDKYGYVNSRGQLVTPIQYVIAEDLDNEGLALVVMRVNGKMQMGCINETGRVVIPIEYDMVGSFIEGIASVRKDGKHGFINTNGRIVIPIQYDGIEYHFKNGLAVVIQGSSLFYIDKNGKFVSNYP